MRLLFVGCGKGSWAVRGLQMARALGARATQQPTAEDFAWADVIVLVKRAIDTHGAAAAQTGKPIVWDVLDYWRQPEDNAVPVAEMAHRIHTLAARHRVSLLIGATQAMAEAIGGAYLPHHSRPGLTPRLIRPEIKIVAYEGTPKYLGSWRTVLEAACAAFGWRFVVNPESLADADLIVALRGEKWDGALCREWKSGVKLVNALAVGRPVITQDSAAVRELSLASHYCDGGIDEPDDIEREFGFWETHPEIRVEVANDMKQTARQFSLDVVASAYGAMLESTLKVAA